MTMKALPPGITQDRDDAAHEKRLSPQTGTNRRTTMKGPSPRDY